MEPILILIIFIVAFIPRFLSARSMDMTWDESTYTFCGLTAIRNVAQLDFSPDVWGLEFHPPITMYFYGVAYAAYVFLITLLKKRRKISLNLLYQEGIRLFKGRQALVAIRLPSIVLGSLSCVITYLFCLDVFKNMEIGVIASLFLALTPAFIAWSSLAMLESGVTFFCVLTIWTLFRAIEYNSIGYLVISGFSLGLALGSKETGFGVPLVVLPWSVASLLEAYKTHGLNAVLSGGMFLILWLLLGFASLFISWPWLWRNPVRQFRRNLQASLSTLDTWKGARWYFYITNLLEVTPLLLVFLYGIGILDASFRILDQTGSILVLSWVLFPLILMSMPFIAKRGGAYQILFILPALSILAGLAAHRFLILTPLILGVLILECASIHPFYVDYYNHMARSINRNYRVGWWGEGMGKAISFIDYHASPNSIVWIYGPKSTAFYHSSRVDLRKSVEDEPLFYERTKAGFNVPVDPDIYSLRTGDIKFYFPLYYPGLRNAISMESLRAENVSYILIYRWATYAPQITNLDDTNYNFIYKLRSEHQPALTVKVKSIEVCWVYKVE